MKSFVNLPKLYPGDQVAVISPSAGLPGKFPWVQDLGLDRLQRIFGLKPKEFPTTRLMGSTLQDRARDIMAAFADPENKAVLSSIGGSDQIKLIKYLEPQVFRDNAKPFFGYSDNTHLHTFLWRLGIPS
jgi:muramoyltetrapeptide carboxypeptidase LdcA involved in peptidoglycan recycling